MGLRLFNVKGAQNLWGAFGRLLNYWPPNGGYFLVGIFIFPFQNFTPFFAKISLFFSLKLVHAPHVSRANQQILDFKILNTSHTIYQTFLQNRIKTN